MALLPKWSTSFETGLAIFDQQHKEIFSMIENLDSLLTRNAGSDLILEAYSSFVRAMHTHLATENELLLEFEYPGYTKQEREHLNELKRLDTLEQKLRRGQTASFAKDLTEIAQRFFEHMTGPDRAYAEFLICRGAF